MFGVWLALKILAILMAMSLVEQMSLADVKNRLSEVVDRLEREHGRVVITKHGHPAAVVISLDDLESLEETLDVMDSAQLLDDIRESLAELGASDVTVLTREEALNLAWAAPARRALARLPEKVATAAVEFLYGSLAANPHRVGKPLRLGLSGLHSARRGDYRVIYRVNDDIRQVTVLAIEHRSDIYRPRQS
jgi:prevent-host-death family protein